MDSELYIFGMLCCCYCCCSSFLLRFIFSDALARSFVWLVVMLFGCILSFSSNLCIISCISVMLYMRSMSERIACVCAWVPFSGYSTSISKSNWCVKWWNILFGVCSTFYAIFISNKCECIACILDIHIQTYLLAHTHRFNLGRGVDNKSRISFLDLLFALVVVLLFSLPPSISLSLNFLMQWHRHFCF